MIITRMLLPQSKEVIDYLPKAYSVTVGVNVKVSAGKTINMLQYD